MVLSENSAVCVCVCVSVCPTSLCELDVSLPSAVAILHEARVVPQISLFHRVNGQGDRHLLLSQVLPDKSAEKTIEEEKRIGEERSREEKREGRREEGEQRRESLCDDSVCD
jgi:hypothetical protein